MLTPGLPGTVLGKKSFCAFRSPVFKPPLNLADYIGLEMRVRTSNHGFIFNIHPDNMVPSDLFQGFIVIPHRDWAIIQLPFSNMAYTGYGYESFWGVMSSYGKYDKKILDTKNILSVCGWSVLVTCSSTLPSTRRRKRTFALILNT